MDDAANVSEARFAQAVRPGRSAAPGGVPGRRVRRRVALKVIKAGMDTRAEKNSAEFWREYDAKGKPAPGK